MSNTSSNRIDEHALQNYVDHSGSLHEAVGARPGEPLPLSFLAQGEYNVNYVFDVPGGLGRAATRLLLRVNLGSQMGLSDQIGYEMGALEILRPCGRTPRPFFVDGTCRELPYGVGVEEYLPGRPLRYETDLGEAARILADVHATEVPDDAGLVEPERPLEAIRSECEEMFSVYRAWNRASSSVLRRVDRMFCQVEESLRGARPTVEPSHRHLINTELNSGNFLINEDGPGFLVDWEKPVIGEVEQDLAHFLVPTTTLWKTSTRLCPADVEKFVRLYVQAVGGRFDTNGIEERLADYVALTCLRGITWSAMALTHYAADDQAVSNSDTHETILRYLTPDFLDLLVRVYFPRAGAVS